MALDFILAQTKQNIQFLISQGALEKDGGEDILAKLDLSASISKSTRLLVSQTLSSPDPAPQFTASKAQPVEQEPPSYSATTPDNPVPHAAVPSHCVPLFEVKALWGYNEDGKNEKDLSFRKGDIINVTEETNADWWLGKFHGREGLLPSTYVQRLRTPPPRPPSTSFRPASLIPGFYNGRRTPSFPTPSGHGHPGGLSHTQDSSYSAMVPGYPNASHNQGGYTPALQRTSSPSGGSSPQGQLYEQPKKHKIGRLSNTAHAAAGGVGFGAGNAVGSGIIHSIF